MLGTLLQGTDNKNAALRLREMVTVLRRLDEPSERLGRSHGSDLLGTRLGTQRAATRQERQQHDSDSSHSSPCNAAAALRFSSSV